MSTRCQIQVVQEGLDWEAKVTMYHHSDGYPGHIVADIARSYEIYGKGWEAERGRKVAAYLCAMHPGGFEPEDSHELHMDIDYYYILYVGKADKGFVKEEPSWEVEIRQTRSNFSDNPTLENMDIHTKRTPIRELAKEYEAKATT